MAGRSSGDGRNLNTGRRNDSYYSQSRNPNEGYYSQGSGYTYDGRYAQGGYAKNDRYGQGSYGNNDRYVQGGYTESDRYAQRGYANSDRYVQGGYTENDRYVQGGYVNESRYTAGGQTGASGKRRTASSQGATGRNGSGRQSTAASNGRYNGASGRGNGQRRGTQGSRYASDNGRYGKSQPSGGKGHGGQRKKGGRRKFLLFLLIFFVLAVACMAGVLYLRQEGNPISGLAGRSSTATPEVSITLDSLDSPYAIMLDAQNGTVIASKRGDETIYPASMTKIMTVLTAIEHIESLDQTITMSYDYYETLYEQDASRAGFEPGEEAKIRDLLYGALLPSGAECCMELAIRAAGSEETFAELMNQKVQELGLTQTNFVNCTGLHSENQYSTPHEIAKILQAALENSTFREVFTTHSYTVGSTNIHPDGFTFWSSMFKNMSAENVIGGQIMGGKTGFTQAAGYCLASMAEIEGREYIQVTAGWAENPRVQQYHINDAFLGYNVLGRAIAEAGE